jgi:hypothetical protein
MTETKGTSSAPDNGNDWEEKLKNSKLTEPCEIGSKDETEVYISIDCKPPEDISSVHPHQFPQSNNIIFLNMIFVPERLRRKRIATKIMEILISKADALNVCLLTSPVFEREMIGVIQQTKKTWIQIPPLLYAYYPPSLTPLSCSLLPEI